MLRPRMIPVRDSQPHLIRPVVTWTLVALNLLVYVWDRGGNVSAPSTAFADLALRPYELTALVGGHGDPLVLVKLFTSMFLHGNVWHLAGNIVFLAVLGPAVEEATGGPKYVLLYLVAGLVAGLAHVFVNAGSFGGLTGASGAIGGVMGAYFLLFPSSRIQLWVVFETVPVTAWLLLSVWFVSQVFLPQAGVANWAHLGGFLAGMVWVLAQGGREKVLRVPSASA